ncbi:MAG: hypothetical protein RSG75_11700, partial [Cellulosilyticaceae bacterium]
MALVILMTVGSGTELCSTTTDYVLKGFENIVFMFFVMGIPYITLLDVFNVQKRIKKFNTSKVLLIGLFRYIYYNIAFILGALVILPVAGAIDSSYSIQYQEAISKNISEEVKVVPEQEIKPDQIKQDNKNEVTNIKDSSGEKTENQFNVKAFDKELKAFFKNNQIVDAINTINLNQDNDIQEISKTQVNNFINKIVGSKKKNIVDKKDYVAIEEVVKLLEPVEQLNKKEEYEGVQTYYKLKGILEKKQAITKLDEEIGDFNVNIKPIDIENVYTLNVYVHYKIKDKNDFINDVKEAAGTSENLYYFTGYENVWGVDVPDQSLEGAIKPVETEFTQQGVYILDAVETGTMNTVNEQGFENKITTYKEVTQEDIERYYLYDEMKLKADEIETLQKKIDEELAVLKTIIK